MQYSGCVEGQVRVGDSPLNAEPSPHGIVLFASLRGDMAVDVHMSVLDTVLPSGCLELRLPGGRVQTLSVTAPAQLDPPAQGALQWQTAGHLTRALLADDVPGVQAALPGPPSEPIPTLLGLPPISLGRGLLDCWTPGAGDSNRAYLPGVSAPVVPRQQWCLPSHFDASGQLPMSDVPLPVLAAWCGARACLETLCQSWVEAQDSQVWTATLHAAAVRGHVSVLELAWAHAPPDARTAALSVHPPLITAPGPLRNLELVHCAAAAGQAAVLQWLVHSAGVSPTTFTSGAEDGLSPLQVAALAGQPAAVDALMQGDSADVCAQGAAQQNVLHLLASVHPREWRAAHDVVLDMLCAAPQAAALSRARDDWRRVPRHVAHVSGNDALLLALVDAGLEGSTETPEGEASPGRRLRRADTEVALSEGGTPVLGGGEDASPRSTDTVPGVLLVPRPLASAMLSHSGRELMEVWLWQQRSVAPPPTLPGSLQHSRLLAMCRKCAKAGDLASFHAVAAALPPREDGDLPTAQLLLHCGPLHAAVVHDHPAIASCIVAQRRTAWCLPRHAPHTVEKGPWTPPRAARRGASRQLVRSHARLSARDTALLSTYTTSVHKLVIQSVQLGSVAGLAWLLDTLRDAALARAVAAAEQGSCPEQDLRAWWADMGGVAMQTAASRGDVRVLQTAWHWLQSLDAQGEPGMASALFEALVHATEAGHWAAAAWIMGTTGMTGAQPPPLRSGRPRTGNILHWACRLDQTEAVQWLLRTPALLALLNAPDRSGLTPLHIACRSDHEHTVQVLLAAGARVEEGGPGGSVVHLAAASGNLGLVQQLVGSAPHTVHSMDGDGRTPLHAACRRGHVAVAQWLLEEAGADPDAVDAFDASPLLLACAASAVNLVKYLMSLPGVDVARVDAAGRGVLSHAARSVTQRAVRLVTWLLRKAAQLHATPHTRHIPQAWRQQRPPPQKESGASLYLCVDPSTPSTLLPLSGHHLADCTPIGQGAFGRVYKGVREKVSSLPAVLQGGRASAAHAPRKGLRSDVAIKCFREVSISPHYSAPLAASALPPALAPRPGAPDWVLAYLEMAPVFTLPKHPHVLPALQLVYQPLALVTPFCHNGSVQGLLVEDTHPTKRAKDVPMSQRLTWAAQAANGLQELHSHNIVHRDVATRNLLLDRSFNVVVGDFGLARMLGSSAPLPSPALAVLARGAHARRGGPTVTLQAAPPRRRRRGSGSSAYRAEHAPSGGEYVYHSAGGGMLPAAWTAPECLTSGDFSAASDVYAFGVTVWEMVTGWRPWHALAKTRGPAAVAEHVMRGHTLPLPHDVIPAPIRSLLRRCWGPAHRRPTAATCRQWLQRQAALEAAAEASMH